MSVKEMQALDDRGLKAWDDHDADAFCELFAEKFEWTDDGVPQPMRTTDDVRQYMTGWFTAFPDMHLKLLNRVISDDSVGAELEFSGTNTGPMQMGDQQIAPTGKPVRAHGTYFVRTQGGKIVEFHSHPNLMEMMTQLGVRM
jgi:predicted ester cyclase